MEQYFFKITATFSDKNKLYEAFRNHINSLDGTLINGDETLNAFHKVLTLKLDQLNKEFSRCKPLELKEIKQGYSINPDARTAGFRVDGSWNASVYKVKQQVEMVDGFLQTFI